MAVQLPDPSDDQTFVTVAAIDNGSFTLPEHLFVSPSEPTASRTVPSLAFLITHPDPRKNNIRPDRLIFDLGLRGNVVDYTPAQQEHIEKRQPYQLGPTVRQRLEGGGISAEDIGQVLLSHVHWDHTGDPVDFPNAEFLVGAGSLGVLDSQMPGQGSHQLFDRELLPRERTRELPEVKSGGWAALGPFEHAFDLFKDGSVYVLDLPGHLPGHLGLLCRVAPQKWICVCGDAYHDKRLLTGEREIGTWETQDEDGNKRTLCIHVNKEKAAETIDRLAKLAQVEGIEVIAAHDEGWLEHSRHRLFPEVL